MESTATAILFSHASTPPLVSGLMVDVGKVMMDTTSSTSVSTDGSSSSLLVENIRAMRRQECGSYANVGDYLSRPLPPSPLSATSTEPPADAACRFLMAQWCFQVIDYCEFRRETASIALSLLDRFLATDDGQEILLDRDVFQLATMTSLYTAVKVHEPEAMHPQLVSDLSHGAHSAAAVEAMERRMLKATGFRSHPPMALSFVQLFLRLLDMQDPTQRQNVRDAIMDLAQYQTEIASCDYHVSTQCAPSSIALAVVLNAIESVRADHHIIMPAFSALVTHVAELDASVVQSPAMGTLRRHLFEAIAQTGNKTAASAAVAFKSAGKCGRGGDPLDESESSVTEGSPMYESPRSVLE